MAVAKKDAVVVETPTVVQPDLTQLMAIIQQQQEQMNKLMEQVTVLNDEKQELAKVVDIPKVESKIVEKVDPNEFIEVMCLLDHVLTLSTQPFGQGETISFREYGEIQPIIYADLSKMISNCKVRFSDKTCIVLDDRVNKKHNLDRFIKDFSKEALDAIINLEVDNVEEVFGSLSDSQKDNIVAMIVKKACENKDEELNFSKLRKMSAHYKRSIIDIVEEAIMMEEERLKLTEEK